MVADAEAIDADVITAEEELDIADEEGIVDEEDGADEEDVAAEHLLAVSYARIYGYLTSASCD